MGFCCCCPSDEDNNKVAPSPEVYTPENNDENADISPIEKDRRCTDVVFLVLLGIFIVVWIVLLAYCMSFGDIYRIINGYDDCANVCGRQNTPDSNLGCKGADRTNEKYLVVQTSSNSLTDPSTVHRMCVTSCDQISGMTAFLTRCISTRVGEKTNKFFSKTGLTNFFQEVSEDLHMCWEEILYLCIIAFALSIVILILFRFMVGFIVWIVLVGVVVASIIGTIWLWVKYDQVQSVTTTETNDIGQRRSVAWLVYAILATIMTICIFLVILVMRKRIKLVIQLFREAGKAISNMPLLLIEPLLTFIALAIIVGLWIYFAIWIESSGTLSAESNQSAKYVKDSTMKVTRWYNLLGLFWLSQFIIGCQHMIIAGAVATWFFTRNKSKVDKPIITSFRNLVKFHLGTVAVGSFLIAIVQLIRAALKALEYSLRNPQNRVTDFLANCCQCCLGCFEKFLQYLSRNAYIETAMFGYSFCEAGSKAFSLLTTNALRVFAINSVGDFVLFLGKAFVVFCTVLIGMEFIQQKEGVQHSWVPLLLAGLFAYLVSHCFLTVYEMTIDTIFICFCEDCERNDGISRPYYMSRGLMEFVQNSKKALELHDNRSGRAWSEDVTPKQVKTISDTVD